MTLIRYPGSKAKLADAILDHVPDEFMVPLYLSENAHYVEPFFGSGAVGFAVMGKMYRKATVTIADIDIGIVSLWRAVKDAPKKLIRRIREFTPSVDAFYELKERDGEYTNDVDTGFRKLALHRLSVSGFGYMAGGPIGGKSQEGAYTVDCRWRPERMSKSISHTSKLLNKFASIQILNASVFDVLASIEPSDQQAFVYLDPPYYEKGSQLYRYGFSVEEHNRLAAVLADADYGWIASYDDHPTIRELYADCDFQELEIVYSNAVCQEPTRPKNKEILIIPSRVLA